MQAVTDVPLYILGSSLFGAQLAAQLGLPCAFASHLAAQALTQAARAYRQGFDPSGPLARTGAEPHFIGAVNVISADDAHTAMDQHRQAEDEWLQGFFGQQKTLNHEDLKAVRRHPQAHQALTMLDRAMTGTASEVVP